MRVRETGIEAYGFIERRERCVEVALNVATFKERLSSPVRGERRRVQCRLPCESGAVSRRQLNGQCLPQR
jgi:hypothetical protein